ncbi:MAG: hypothetical protein AAF533_08810 [Acidobacteriota bacterium]
MSKRRADCLVLAYLFSVMAPVAYLQGALVQALLARLADFEPDPLLAHLWPLVISFFLFGVSVLAGIAWALADLSRRFPGDDTQASLHESISEIAFNFGRQQPPMVDRWRKGIVLIAPVAVPLYYFRHVRPELGGEPS